MNNISKQDINERIIDASADDTAVTISTALAKNNKSVQPSLINMDKLIDTYCMEKYSIGAAIYSVFHIIMTIVALFLSIRCNSKTIDLGAILVAIFFPYIYIIWVFGTKDLKAQCNL